MYVINLFQQEKSTVEMELSQYRSQALWRGTNALKNTQYDAYYYDTVRVGKYKLIKIMKFLKKVSLHILLYLFRLYVLFVMV